MTRSRLGIRGLGLCAVLLGALALGSSIAQAEVGASWGYRNPITGELKTFGEALEPQLKINGIENKKGILLMGTAGAKIEVTCTSAAIVEGGKLQAQGTISLGRVAFSECLAFINGAKVACLPRVGEKLGVIESKKVTALLVLHKLVDGTLDPFIMIKPDSGTTLAVIEFGEECAIGPWPITGQLALRDCTNQLRTLLVEHLIEEAPVLSTMALGGNPARIDGSSLLKLSGIHEGIQWEGSPA